MKRLILLLLIGICLTSCRSPMDMQQVSGMDFYAFADSIRGRSSELFPLLYKDIEPKNYEYLNFKMHFEGRYLHLTYDKIQDSVLITETKVFKGKWRKRGWKYVQDRVILPFFPFLGVEGVDKVYIKPKAQGVFEMYKYGREWGFSTPFFSWGGDSYNYTLTFKPKEKIYPSAVFYDNKRLGLLQGNKVLLPAEYSEMSVFKEGVSRVRKDSLWGIISAKGEELTPLQYNEIIYNECYNIPSFFMVKKDNLWGVIGLKGEELLPTKYRHLEYIYPASLIASKDSLWGIIDINSKYVEILPFQYDYIKRSYRGYTLEKGGKIGFLSRNSKENWFIPPEYTKIDDNTLDLDMALVYKGTTPYFVDKEGNEYDALENKVSKMDKFLGYPQRENEVQVKDGYYLLPNLKTKRPIRTDELTKQ